MLSEIEIIKRLILSAILGGFIGIEREVNNRPAGLRTHILVSLGSALIMLISMDGLYSLDVSRSPDPARLASQVVSGIGFLGAGTIMREGNNINGLTTAASLWVSAGIGLAIGAGYYLGGIIAGVIALGTLMKLGRFEKRIPRKRFESIKIISIDQPGLLGKIGEVCGKYNLSIRDISMVYKGDEDEDGNIILESKFLVKIPNGFDIGNFYREMLEIEGILKLDMAGKNKRIRDKKKSSLSESD